MYPTYCEIAHLRSIPRKRNAKQKQGQEQPQSYKITHRKTH